MAAIEPVSQRSLRPMDGGACTVSISTANFLNKLYLIQTSPGNYLVRFALP